MNEIIIDGIRIIDYISPMKPYIICNPEQDRQIAKVYEECKQILITNPIK